MIDKKILDKYQEILTREFEWDKATLTVALSDELNKKVRIEADIVNFKIVEIQPDKQMSDEEKKL